MYVGFQALADHADGVANIVLGIEKKFLREDVKYFAIFGQLHATSGLDGPAHIVALNIAWTRGHGDAADSWVKTGPNQPIGTDQLERAIGPDVLASLTKETGLSREELLSRLTRELPDAVDKFTPHGRLPTEDEASRLI